MKHTYKTNQHLRKAFTLIELLIVIAIIGILFIVLVSKVDFATDKAKSTGVQTDFRSFQLAFNTVARENQGFENLIKENDYSDLENAINQNLDNELKISIDKNGIITMANGAKDPWDVEYHGQYVTGDDGKDRGAIVMYSNGANLTFGSDISITGGITSINIVDDVGKDDYSIISCYSLTNGYGTIDNQTSGFGNNQGIVQNGTNNNNSSTEPGGSPDEVVVSIPYETREPGLYETGTNNLLYSWQELIDLNIVTSKGAGVGSSSFYKNGPNQAVIDFLVGDLQYPNNIDTVPGYAFYQCKNLTGLILTSGTTTLEDYAFGICGKFDMLRIYGAKNFNNGIASTDTYKFYFDTVDSLLSSNFYSSFYYDYYNVSNGMFADTQLYIKDVLVEHLIIPEGYETFCKGLFSDCGGLKTVTLPSSFTTIPLGGFQKCINLTSINLENVKYVNKCAFNGSTSISSVNLENVIEIYVYAFGSCTGLNRVDIGNKITFLECGSFGSCNESLELHFNASIDLWNSILDPYTYLGEKNGITNGKKYRLFIEDIEMSGQFIVPSHWTHVSDYLFSGLTNITSVVLHDNIVRVGSYAFYDLPIVNIEWANIKEIGRYAFYQSQINKLEVPDSVTRIEEYAFGHCENIEYININESSQLEHLGNGAFSYCKKIKSLYIPPLIKELDAHYLVLYCNSLTEFTFSPNTQLEYLNVYFGHVKYVTVYLPDTVKIIKDLGINVNYCSDIVIGENSQLERMEGTMFDRYVNKTIYIPKNIYYISDGWADFQFSPNIIIHPENTHFKVVDGCFIDIDNGKIRASVYSDSVLATIPTDGSVTTLCKSSGNAIRYIPLCITSINYQTWNNATGYMYVLTYEGTMEQWKSITAGQTMGTYFKSVQCSDGTLDRYGNIIE
jgi:prepilin-type N-terminal cleavage/methylation domain-containing protein